MSGWTGVAIINMIANVFNLVRYVLGGIICSRKCIHLLFLFYTASV